MKKQASAVTAEPRYSIRIEFVVAIAVVCFVSGAMIGSSFFGRSEMVAELVAVGNEAYNINAYPVAISAYEKALKRDPRNPDVLTDTGTMYLQMGQVDTAIARFRQAIAVDPDHANSRFNLGIAYMSGKKDFRRAAEQFRECLSIAPEGKTAAAAKGHLEAIEKMVSKP